MDSRWLEVARKPAKSGTPCRFSPFRPQQDGAAFAERKPMSRRTDKTTAGKVAAFNCKLAELITPEAFRLFWTLLI